VGDDVVDVMRTMSAAPLAVEEGSMADQDVHGPVDVTVIEFPGDATGAGVADALLGLVERGTIALYDLMVVRKEANGSCVEVDLSAAGADHLGSLRLFAGARSGLVGADDLDDVAAVLENGATAVVLVYENTWAAPFVAAARSEGGELVASVRLSAQQIMDALDAVDTV
jgi:hypothetical protein